MDSDEELNELLDRPTSPAPIPPLSDDIPATDPCDGNGSPPPSIMPTLDDCVPLSANSRKRPAEDVTQLASTVSRKIKLNAEDRESVSRFAKASPEEQQLLSYGQLLKLSTQLAAIHPSNAMYTVPALLKSKISKHSARTVLNSGVSAYKADLALKAVETVLLNHPAWGYTKTVKGDVSKNKVVKRLIQKDLTDVRHDIKKTIGDSMWLPSAPKVKRTFEKLAEPGNIITLCEALVSMPSVKAANIPVTFDMLGRVAVLRAVLIKYPDEVTYWDKVDRRLERIWNHGKNNPTEISRAIGKILAEDQRLHAVADVEPIRAAAAQAPAAADTDDSGDEAVTVTT
ncbi:hypothetical protein B0H14DRAFT_3616773 [Mycena olivaceomarginata]|nr:hypothetical protein B0H14DRAFT_3616773 [Mycena olivaceomarginata]